MKRWSQQIFFLTTFVLMSASMSVSAQDAGMSDVEILQGRAAESDKVVFTPGEDIQYVPHAPNKVLAKDSIALQMHDFPMQRAAEKPAPKKDESILTFNFLYYIIQKYKLQDIID